MVLYQEEGPEGARRDCVQKYNEGKKEHNESKKKFESAKDLSDSEAMTDLERETEHAMHEAEVAMLKGELAVAEAKLSVAEAELSVAETQRDMYLKDRGDNSSEYQSAVQQVGIALREVENATTAREQCQQRLAAAEGALVAGTFSSS